MGVYSADFRPRALPAAISGYFARASAATDISAAGVYSQVSSGAAAYDGLDGLILEAAATNLLLRSQEIDNASWTKTRTNVTANAATGPDGLSTADKLYDDASAATTHKLRQSYTKAASAIQYTFSVYLKAAEYQYAVVMLTDSSETSGVRVGINLATGALSGAAQTFGATWTGGVAGVSDCGNGWYRVSVSGISDTGTSVNSWVCLSNTLSSSPPSYDGNGASGIYVWGAQLETGAFPTSYIPTTTATATRAASYIGNVPLNELGLLEKKNDFSVHLVLEMPRSSSTSVGGGIVIPISIGYGTSTTERVIIYVPANGANTISLFKYSSLGNFVIAGTWSGSKGDLLNIRFKISTDGIKFLVNDATYTGTSSEAKSGFSSPMTVLAINRSTHNPQNYDWVTYRGFKIWDYALSDAELAALTTDIRMGDDPILFSPIRSVFRSAIVPVIRS